MPRGPPLLMEYTDRLDWDAEDDESVDREDAALVDRQVQYYETLGAQGLLGEGFFDANLRDFHQGVDLNQERTFSCSPRPLVNIDRVGDTPTGHPLRAIAWILDDADRNSIIRVYCSRLTDLAAFDLLIYAGHNRDVRIILHPTQTNEIAIAKFFDSTGAMGRGALLENLEIRLANLSGASCESSKVSMHRKSVITERYSTFGSYNLSAFGRVGNWEDLCVVNTTKTPVVKFDELWESLVTRPAEKFYDVLKKITPGPRRARRAYQRQATISQAQKRERSR